MSINSGLIEIVDRDPNPRPWSEGDNIPWNEPGFSRRMLAEHLTQEHDAASRRFRVIDRHVNWIHRKVLKRTASRILDLGCGPGLYTSRLAKKGHTCTGIDFSPASIDYAGEQAQSEHLACTYFHQDIRQADYGEGYDLVMLIFGEFNVFKSQDAGLILQKAWQALTPGGKLLLEPHPYPVIQKLGTEPSTWYSSSGGLFLADPHIALQENFWDAATHTTTRRHYVLDARSGEVKRYAQSFQAYTTGEYLDLLYSYGFERVEIFPALAVPKNKPIDSELIAILACKAERSAT